MRLLFLLVVMINVGLFAYGRGYFGTPPDDIGRSAPRVPINSEIVTLGDPVLNPSVAR